MTEETNEHNEVVNTEDKKYDKLIQRLAYQRLNQEAGTITTWPFGRVTSIGLVLSIFAICLTFYMSLAMVLDFVIVQDKDNLCDNCLEEVHR